MPDQDRLREEIIDLAEYLSCTADELWNELKPIIAREVRLGKIEELKTILFGAYGTDDISGRIKELEDE